MAITDQEIAAFVQKLASNDSPAWDPGWNVTNALVEIVRVQARDLLVQQQALRIGSAAAVAAVGALVGGLRGGLQTQVHPGNLTQLQVDAALADLKSAITAAQSGQQVAQYAGQVLGFVGKILV